MGPTFDGSRLCSADADLIVDGTLLEDVDADDLVTRGGGGTFELVRDQLVILTPRAIVVLRVPASMVTAIRRVCDLPARWGGVRLPPVDDASRRPRPGPG